MTRRDARNLLTWLAGGLSFAAGAGHLCRAPVDYAALGGVLLGFMVMTCRSPRRVRASPAIGPTEIAREVVRTLEARAEQVRVREVSAEGKGMGGQSPAPCNPFQQAEVTPRTVIPAQPPVVASPLLSVSDHLKHDELCSALQNLGHKKGPAREAAMAAITLLGPDAPLEALMVEALRKKGT